MAVVAVRSAGDPAVEGDIHYDTYSREYGSACQTTGDTTGSSGGHYDTTATLL